MVRDAPQRNGSAAPDPPPAARDPLSGDDAGSLLDPNVAAARGAVVGVVLLIRPVDAIGPQATDPPRYRLMYWLVDRVSRWWHVVLGTALLMILAMVALAVAAGVIGPVLPSGRWVIGVAGGSVVAALTGGGAVGLVRRRRHASPPAPPVA